jgi:hypothetical protein
MWRKFPITHIGDLAITGTRLAVLGSLLLWLLFTLLGIFVFALAPATAVFGGLLATLLHWLSGLLHHLGHARAARRTGYPMREVRLLHVLAASIYPRDEPELPAEIHIRRALGGPPVNIVLGLAGLVIVLLLPDGGGLWYLLALFFAQENLLVYGLGAFMPLGFTDGSTLLEWWPRRGQ